MFSNRRKSAILELHSKQVIDKNTGKITIERITYEAWQRDASETIRKYLGTDTKFYTDFIALKIINIPIQQKPTDQELALEYERMAQANVILSDCIVFLNNGGYLYRRPILFGWLPVTAQVTIFGVFGTLMYNIGHNTVPEKQTFEAEYKDCQQAVKNLSYESDSLRKVITRMQNESTPEKPKPE